MTDVEIVHAFHDAIGHGDVDAAPALQKVAEALQA